METKYEVGINWEPYRRTDGSIDLVAAFQANTDITSARVHAVAEVYLRRVEQLQRINSRQTAATVLATIEVLTRL